MLGCYDLLCGGGGAVALEDDNVSEAGLNRLRGAGHDSSEETNCAIRIDGGVWDVGPLEVALIVDRVEGDSVTTRERCRDQGLQIQYKDRL